MAYDMTFISRLIGTCLLTCIIARPVLAVSEDNHYKLLELYAHMASAAFFAEEECPGVKANQEKLLALRSMAKITDNERTMVAENIKAVNLEIRIQFEKIGRLGWCSDTYSGIGPNGKLLKGIIFRE